MPLSATAREFSVFGGAGQNREASAGDTAGNIHVGIAKGFSMANNKGAAEFRPMGSEHGDEMRKPFAELGLLGANHHGYSDKTLQKLSCPPLDWDSAAQPQATSSPEAHTSGMTRHQQIPSLGCLEPKGYLSGMTAQRHHQQQMACGRVVSNFNRAQMMHESPTGMPVMPQAGGSTGHGLSFHPQIGEPWQWCQHQRHANSLVGYNHQMMYPQQVLGMEESDSTAQNTQMDLEFEAHKASEAAWKESEARAVALELAQARESILQANLQRESKLTSDRHRELDQLKQVSQKFASQKFRTEEEKKGILSRLVIGAAKGSVAGGSISSDSCVMPTEEYAEAAAEDDEKGVTREGEDTQTGPQTEQVASCDREAKEEGEEDGGEEGKGKDSCDELIQDLSKLLLG